MDPIYTSLYRLIFQTLSVKLKIKIYGNDRMYSKLYVLPKNYLILFERSKNKNYTKDYYYQTFLLMSYVDKTPYFEVAPPGHTIAYKNIDNLFKK